MGKKVRRAKPVDGHRCKRISAVGRQEDAGEKCGNDALSSHCSRQLYPITPVPPYHPDRARARGPEPRCGRSRCEPDATLLPSFPPSFLLIYRLPANFPIARSLIDRLLILPPFVVSFSIYSLLDSFIVYRFIADNNRNA